MKTYMQLISIVIILVDLYFLTLSFKGAITLIRLCNKESQAELVTIIESNKKFVGIYKIDNVSFNGEAYIDKILIQEKIIIHYQSNDFRNYYIGSTLSYLLGRIDVQILFLIVFFVMVLGDKRRGLA